MMALIAAALLAVALAAAALAYADSYTRRVERLWPAEGRFIESQGARVHVREAGPEDAPRILLIHGASANLRELWRPLADALAQDHRVIAFDRPGYGHSTRPRRNAHTLALQAHMAADVLHATGKGPALIVAHSLGAAVALRLALEAPLLVRGLVLIAPASHPYPGKNAWWARLSSAPILGDLFCTLLIPWLGPIVGKGSVANNFYPSQVPQNYYDDAGVGLIFRPGAFRASARDVCATNDEFAAQAPRYPDIFTPAIVITGDVDKVVSPKRHARGLARDLPAVELVTAPDAGHMPHRLRTDLVLSAVARAHAMASAHHEG
ncbi:MAG: alpha/beta fold hydrolase [Hyphomonadaceae bacterium]|nr:alpha/beta fold hydrolase [Hyphomonadaceae bacterium]